MLTPPERGCGTQRTDYPAPPVMSRSLAFVTIASVTLVMLTRSSSVARAVADPSAVTRPATALHPPTGGTVMSAEQMTPDEEYESYACPENQEPQGSPRRRNRRLTAPIPVRFTDEQLDAICQRAETDDRSVSAWIRRAVEHELDRGPA